MFSIFKKKTKSKYYKLSPEVAGGFGDKTELDTTTHPPIVHKLEYRIEGWLGDDILETFPCYIISDKLLNLIESSNLNGYEIDTVNITCSDDFLELYPDITIPKFHWFKITGIPGQDDFGYANNCLVVSQSALNVLNQSQITNCDIESYNT